MRRSRPQARTYKHLTPVVGRVVATTLIKTQKHQNSTRRALAQPNRKKNILNLVQIKPVSLNI
jgi:hypothetical protein